MAPLRFAVFGTGFWATYQLAAWREVPGAECVAVYNRTRAKAEALAARFGVPAVYDDPEKLLAEQKPDFIDIITDVDTHPQFVHLAARHGVGVICQKPLAPRLADAEAMVEACRATGVPLLVHENWRWQTPIRELKHVLDSGAIGDVFRARIDMVSGFPVFANQPFLVDLERFVLTDMGSHTLDAARFLFGEPRTLYCQTHRTLPHIKGENVATVMMNMDDGRTTVLCQMGYAENPLERECFPETLAFIEGDRGSVELTPGFWLRVTTKDGTLARKVSPPVYPWANPAYAVVHSSIVPCNVDLLRHLRGEGTAETNGDDNLKTVRLVFAAYDSARDGRVVRFEG
jgi:predicted dehydrogenase